MKNPVFDSDNWREIFATLSRNKTRTLMTAFGIFWGTAMLAMLWGGAAGLRGMMMRNFQGFSTNLGAVFPMPTTMPYHGYQKNMSWSIQKADIDYFRRLCPYIEYSSPMMQTSGTMRYADKTSSGQLIGVESDYFRMQTPVIYEGRVLNESDNIGMRKNVALGKNRANELFGSESALGKFVEINGIYFKVVGVIGQKSDASIGGRLDDSAIIPSNIMQRTFGTDNNYGAMIFTAKPGHTPKELKKYFWRAVIANHPISPADEGALRGFDVSEMFEMVENLFLGISLLALFVGVGSLMAGVIGVGNIMWIIVKERTQEIGIRRAIGATPKDIIIQILSESMTLTVLAGVLGVSFATLVLFLANKLTYDPVLGPANFALSFSDAIGIVVAFLVLGSLAGIVPAIRAMRIKPIEALNDK